MPEQLDKQGGIVYGRQRIRDMVSDDVYTGLGAGGLMGGIFVEIDPQDNRVLLGPARVSAVDGRGARVFIHPNGHARVCDYDGARVVARVGGEIGIIQIFLRRRSDRQRERFVFYLNQAPHCLRLRVHNGDSVPQIHYLRRSGDALRRYLPASALTRGNMMTRTTKNWTIVRLVLQAIALPKAA